MFFNQCCCNNLPSSSGSSGSGSGTPPEELEDECSRGNCSGAVIPRNFRVAWDWQPTIHEGEIVLATPPAGDSYWHVKTYGSVCTSKYTTGGWLLKFKEYTGAYPQYAGCTWESDERMPHINYTNDDDEAPYPGSPGYPAYCTDTTHPICRLTIGDGIFAAGNAFTLEIWSPYTGSSTYPAVKLIYSGRIAAEDGKTDCMAATTLHLVPGSGTPVFRGYPSGIAFQDGSPAWIPSFVFNGAYYDGGFIFDDTTLDPEDPLFAYLFNFPPLPTSCVVTPA